MLALAFSVLLTAHAADPDQPAIDAANTWLALVDSGKYAESWTTGATYFKNAITSANWTMAAHAARDPLGALVSRKVSTHTAATSLPGAPDGHYVVIQYQAVFANKKSAIETVTPMQEADGTWHVSGYFIK
jgi:hypothetical protein